MKITKEKCSYADRYNAIRPPTCGCRFCYNKFLDERIDFDSDETPDMFLHDYDDPYGNHPMVPSANTEYIS